MAHGGVCLVQSLVKTVWVPLVPFFTESCAHERADYVEGGLGEYCYVQGEVSTRLAAPQGLEQTL